MRTVTAAHDGTRRARGAAELHNVMAGAIIINGAIGARFVALQALRCVDTWLDG